MTWELATSLRAAHILFTFDQLKALSVTRYTEHRPDDRMRVTLIVDSVPSRIELFDLPMRDEPGFLLESFAEAFGTEVDHDAVLVDEACEAEPAEPKVARRTNFFGKAFILASGLCLALVLLAGFVNPG